MALFGQSTIGRRAIMVFVGEVVGLALTSTVEPYFPMCGASHPWDVAFAGPFSCRSGDLAALALKWGRLEVIQATFSFVGHTAAFWARYMENRWPPVYPVSPLPL